MKRIVWVAATILIMICIMGYGIFSMKQIEKVNQERREKESAKQAVSQIVLVTETTNVYDRYRSTEDSQAAYENETAEGEAIPSDGNALLPEGETETTLDPNAMRPAVLPTSATEPETNILPEDGEAAAPDVQAETDVQEN